MREAGAPEGSPYDWFRRASELLDRGDAGASLILIERVLEEDPSSRAALEIRARALFDSGHYAEAAEAFAQCLESSPDDDYAHYGAGMSLWRLQRFPESRDHLAMASVMRPDRKDYATALSQVRATLAAREEAGLPLSGPLDAPPILGLDTMVAGYPPTDEGPRPISDFWPGPLDGVGQFRQAEPSSEPSAGLVLAEAFDVALLDLDGVVYIGQHAVPGAADGLAAARDLGMALTFVTNNASRSPQEVAAHLTELGVPALAEEVVTSSQAGANLLAARLPAGANVLAIGGEGVALALADVGLVPVRAAAAEGRDIAGVLQGFGRDVAWSDLAAATLAVSRGALWIATNPDVTLPVPGGRAPGNGALVAAVATALGREPDDVAGKPYPALMEASIERTAAQRPLVVGDRLDTDIAGAHAVGVPSLLVLTGVSDIAAVLGAVAGERPDFLGADLAALTAAPAPTFQPTALYVDPASVPRREGEAWACGTARAWIDGGVLSVEFGDGGWLRALQCACLAAWSADQAPDVAAAADAIEALRRTVGS